MKKSYLAIIGALVVLLSSGASLAGQDKEDGDKRHDRRWSQDRGPDFGRMIEHLELDEEQAQVVTNIMEASKPEFESLRQRTRANHEATRSLDVSAADFGTRLQNLAAENGELTAAMTILQGRVRADVHAVLTPEQQQKLVEAAVKRQQRFREKSARSAK